MASNSKKRKNSSYDNDGFDMKSLGALLVIIIGVAVIIVLVRSMGGSGNGSDSGDVPAATSSESYSQPEASSQVDTPEDVSSEAESQPTFTVTVTGLDGSYSRTNVESANAATLKISSQDSKGFDFSLTLSGTTYAGYAAFVSVDTAQWSYDGNVLSFECSSGSITLSGYKAVNGSYTTAAPTYTDAPESKYDSDIINSSATRSTLSDIMSSDDYSLLKRILDDGSRMGVSESSSEYQTDKNGVGIMVDKKTGMIKYQYELKYEGRCMILCSTDGKVCIGIYNENDGSGELRYYASTSALRSEEPDCIKNYAVAYDLTLTGC